MTSQHRRQNNTVVRIIRIIKRAATATPLPQRFLRDVPYLCSARASCTRTLSDKAVMEIVTSKAGAPTDRDMLLLVTVFHQTFKGLSAEELEKVGEGTALAEIQIPVSELRWFHAGKIQRLTEAVERLAVFTVIYTPDGGKEKKIHRYLSSCSVADGFLTALIDRDTGMRTIKCSWNVDILELTKLKTRVGRALYLMLAPDHRNIYDALKLADRLGLPNTTAIERRNSIRDIHNGFKDMATAGVLKTLPGQHWQSIPVTWTTEPRNTEQDYQIVEAADEKTAQA